MLQAGLLAKTASQKEPGDDMSIYGVQFHGIEQLLLLNLQRINSQAAIHALRLSTGKRVNEPRDAPAEFVQISSFESQLAQIKATKLSVDLASNVGAAAQLSVDEIRTQLSTIRTKLVADAGLTLTSAQRDANQAQIDAAIDQINALSQTATNGKNYLNGSSYYSFQGRDPAQVKDVQVYSLRSTTIAGTVSSAATRASATHTGAGMRINGAAAFTLTGERGSHAFTVTNNELLTDVRDRINQYSHETGITATVSGNLLTFTTVDYGTDAVINISVTSGTFATVATTAGADAVVTINGEAISSSNVDGNRVMYNRNGLHFTMDLVAGFSGALSTITVSDTNVSKFALTPNPARLTSFSIQSVAASAFSGISGVLTDIRTGGTVSGLGTNTSAAIRIVDEALGRLTQIEGQVDGFAEQTVASASRLMTSLQTGLEDTLTNLNGVDEDKETLALAALESLAANTVSALSILQQQNTNVLGILQLLAGV